MISAKAVSYTEGYRSGHNEAVLKTSFVCLCNFLKTLDFIGFFAVCSALCEKRFSQFSRNFPWLGLRFLIKLNTRRVIEVVITRRSWKPFAFTGAWVRISHPPPLALEFVWIPRLFLCLLRIIFWVVTLWLQGRFRSPMHFLSCSLHRGEHRCLL